MVVIWFPFLEICKNIACQSLLFSVKIDKFDLMQIIGIQ